MRRLLLAAVFALSSATAAAAAATPTDDLHAVIKDHWAWFLKSSPVHAREKSAT